MKKHIHKTALLALAIFPVSVFANGPKPPSEAANPYAIAMMSVAAVLLLAIVVASQMLLKQAKSKMQRFKKQAAAAAKIVTMFLLLLTSSSLFAQDAAPDATAVVPEATTVAQLSLTSFYGLVTVIGVELLILLALLYQLKALMTYEEETDAIVNEAGEAVVIAKESSWKKLWEKANSFRPIKEEAAIDLGHNYDGIRELDNRLPPWWLYGFYITIIFAGIYLWRYHVTHTAPSSKDEYQAAMMIAAEQKEAYLAKSKSNVDENTVKLLTDGGDIEAGKKVFTSVCAACHGVEGGGGVGPNLTDDYWLHGGSVKDVFKSITYGWTDKGMKSWKDDYSPLQIEQITSYIKSIHGTKPSNPKEPQGDLFEETNEAAPVADSTSVKPEDKGTAMIN